MMQIRFTTMESELFGKRLRAERRAKGLTQVQLAAAMGATYATVSQWETGVPSSVDAEMLLRAAKALGVTADWLLYGLDPVVAEAPGSYDAKAGLTELLSCWGDLTSTQRAAMIADAKALARRNREILDELTK